MGTLGHKTSRSVWKKVLLTMKKCTKCFLEKEETEFHTHKQNERLRPDCKDCVNKRNSKYKKDFKELHLKQVKNWQKRNPDKVKDYSLRTEYGITLATYNQMAFAQAGKCLICMCDAKLVVDHCHATGFVRGLLCDSCNKALGGFKDDLERLKRAINYLEKANDNINNKLHLDTRPVGKSGQRFFNP